MLVPRPGVAFTEAEDGDQRGDHVGRAVTSRQLGIPEAWATVSQVHGAHVVEVTRAGDHGEADAMITDVPVLPLAVFTADCLGVVIRATRGLGVAHAGWRGLDTGVLQSVLDVFERNGWEAIDAVVGPAIGPCCFEVGPEVAARFPRFVSSTTWGTVSVDLPAVAADQLGIPLQRVGECTRCGANGLSHRRDRTPDRMAALGWMPSSLGGSWS